MILGIFYHSQCSKIQKFSENFVGFIFGKVNPVIFLRLTINNNALRNLCFSQTLILLRMADSESIAFRTFDFERILNNDSQDPDENFFNAFSFKDSQY